MTKQKKALWAIAVLIGVPVGLNLIGLAIPKRYTAEMRLLVDQSLQHAQITEDPLQPLNDISEFDRPRSTQTQLDILTGTDVLQRALELGAKNLPNKIKDDASSASQQYEDLLRRVAVDNELNSDILSVRVTQNDPEVAAELANDIGEAYAEYVRNLAKGGGADELRALATEIDDSKVTLTAMDRQIAYLKAKNNIFDVMQSGAAEANTKSLNDQRLAQVEGEYRGSVAALADAEVQLKTIPQVIPSGNRKAVNPVLFTIQDALATERTTLADLQAQWYDESPLVKREKKRVRDLEAQEKKVEKQIGAESDFAVNPVYQTQLESVETLRSQVQSTERQVNALKAASDHSAQVLAGIPGAEQQLQSLIRERTVAEQNFEALEQKRSIIQAIGMARQPSARIVSTALPPSRPSFPDSRLLTMGGFALGAFFAILILMPRPQTPESFGGQGSYGSLSNGVDYEQLAAGDGTGLAKAGPTDTPNGT